MGNRIDECTVNTRGECACEQWAPWTAPNWTVIGSMVGVAHEQLCLPEVQRIRRPMPAAPPAATGGIAVNVLVAQGVHGGQLHMASMAVHSAQHGET